MFQTSYFKSAVLALTTKQIKYEILSIEIKVYRDDQLVAKKVITFPVWYPTLLNLKANFDEKSSPKFLMTHVPFTSAFNRPYRGTDLLNIQINWSKRSFINDRH